MSELSKFVNKLIECTEYFKHGGFIYLLRYQTPLLNNRGVRGVKKNNNKKIK